MSTILAKGGNLSLTKAAPGLGAIDVGLGWDIRGSDGDAFDLDASAILLGADGKVRSDRDFIFYNQRQSACGAVVHQGDNRTGAGEGDDEIVAIDLARLPAGIERLVFVVSIHEAAQRRQNFGQVANARIRVCDKRGGAEIARFDLSEDGATETAMIFGEVYRHGGEWKFRAVGQGHAGGLGPLARSFGIDVN